MSITMPPRCRRRTQAAMLLTVSALCLTAAARADQPAADTAAVERLNAYRKAAGLAPVEQDADLSKGCQAHARYLAQNIAQLNKGLRIDDEDPALPGFSEDGRRAAKASFSAFDRKDPAAPIYRWMAALFIRLNLLDPELRRVGWGAAQDAGKGWVVVLDLFRGKGSTQVVVYPADGQKDVPVSYPGTEIPDPIPEATRKLAGYPV